MVPTSGVVAAVFTHAVSRNGDPHLHSHVVMANLVHGEDGRWSACDRRGLDAHRTAASAVYEAHLRAGLASALGVRWTPAPGAPPRSSGSRPSCWASSRLGAPTSAATCTRRAPLGRGARVAWAATRPAKAPGAPFADAGGDWRRRAAAVGGRLELAARAAAGPAGPAALDEHRFAGVLSLTAARRGAPPRRRGGLRRGRPGRRRRPSATRTTRRASGCRPVRSAWPSRSSSAATVVPGTATCRALGPTPGRSGRARGVGGRRPGPRGLPGSMGPRAQRAEPLGARPVAKPGLPAGRVVWPITSAPSDRWRRRGPGSGGASR